MSEQQGPSTKDYRTIIVLTYQDHVPTRIEAVNVRDGERRIMLYHYGAEAQEDYDAWNMGSREAPFDVLRKVFECEDMFKNNLHRFQTDL
jgi:hypothetical protein